jgi:2-C-methyl-D-erythritol 4-phosphate cytidylyltransferase
LPLHDTIKRVENGQMRETYARETLCAVQTPQVFEASLLRAAHARAEADGAELTDDCAAVERLGFPVTLVPGEEENRKLTTPIDLLLGEAILEGRF